MATRKHTTKKINYKGWPNCCRLSNGLIDLIATADVGPRIIRFGFVGDANELKEYAEQLGKTGGKSWRIYGGHRLWHAPEGNPRSYFPDNSPVRVEKCCATGIRLTQPTETTTGIQKEIDICLAARDAHVVLTHRLRNNGLWPVELAPWALSVMAQGGVAIIPLPPRGEHPRDLLPVNTLTLWAYTDMSDPRWTFGNKYILLRQDPQAAHPQKIGAAVPNGWAGYVRNGHLFVKMFQHVAGARYVDSGCNFEAFTNADMLELESLGPLVNLAPGAIVEHVEHWFLFHDVPTPHSDADVNHYVLPKVKTAKVS